MTPSKDTPMLKGEESGTDLIAEAITEQFGERCPDFDADCYCCKVWKQYDELRAGRPVPNKERAIDDIAARIELEQTCFACPEQYEAKLDGTVVGYLRLRHGWFRVDYPDCGGKVVFEANPKGDGIFEDDERDGFLTSAKRAIANAILTGDDHPALTEQGEEA